MRGHPIQLILGFIVLVILAGCSSATPSTPQPTATLAENLPSPTVEILPTETTTPMPGKAVLISPDNPSGLLADVFERVRALAAQDGLSLEERTSFQASDIASDWRVVVLTNTAPSLSEALTANPGVQFIVFSDQELGAAPNLSVIRTRWDYQAFLSGYLAILITPDWRTGAFFHPDDTGSMQSEAFINGAQYFCGVCSSKLSPILRFPVTARLAGDAESGAWQTEVDAMLSNIIYVMYIGPGTGSPEMLNYLAQKGVVLVGAETPPDELRSRWAATVTLDFSSPLENAWQKAVAGEGGLVVDTPVRVTDINEEFYSSGRQMLLEQTLKDLEDGWIYPLDVAVE